MPKKIKLIWDFRGTEAEATATHHAKHLKEYATTHKKTKDGATGYEKISPMHSIAYFVVTEANMPAVRDALKPQRGEYVD